MRIGLLFSAAVHVLFLALVIVGLSFGEPLTPEPVDSIAVDLVPIEEFSNIRQGSLDSDVVQTDTPSAVQSDEQANLAQPTGNTEEDQPTPDQAPTPSPRPVTNTAPQDQPEPEPEPTPQPAAPPAPVEPAPSRPAATPPAAAEPQPEPDPAPEPVPTTETPELTAPSETAEPTPAAPAPVARTASLEQKRAEFKRQQDAQKKAAEEAQRKAEADAKAKAEADAKAKAAEDARKKAAEEKRIADAKAKEEADRKAAEERRRQQQASRQADDISDIINNEQSRGGTTGQGGSPTLGRPDGRSATLSNSQIAALGAQIKGCLVSPPGIEDSGIVVYIQFSVDGAGNPVGTPRPTSAPAAGLEQSYASAAVRAIMRCGPYSMVAGQDVRVTFDPKQF